LRYAIYHNGDVWRALGGTPIPRRVEMQAALDKLAQRFRARFVMNNKASLETARAAVVPKSKEVVRSTVGETMPTMSHFTAYGAALVALIGECAAVRGEDPMLAAYTKLNAAVEFAAIQARLGIAPDPDLDSLSEDSL
jgi:hydroxyethylthiazole kinase-like sugar kinase family protein